MSSLSQRSALVTGAASGIGRATAQLLAAAGAAIVALDRSPDVEQTVAHIRAAGGRAIALIGDASVESELERAVSVCVSEHGGLHVFHANAGISGGLPSLFEETVDRFHEVLRINLVGTFALVRLAARHMVRQGRGSIICTASVAGLRAGAGGIPYSASKAGVISLVQTIAAQLAGTGVRINAVCPGLIETGMTRPIFEQARARGTQDRIGQLNPLRRCGEADEIAQMVLFLASDAASYVNGQAIAVDGGLSSSLPVVVPRR